MSYLSYPRRDRGFSVVELMVSVVVGLLALTFATRMFLNGEQNKQASLGGSDSMQNGMQALFSISGDAAQAGWGLNDPIINGCDTLMTDSGGYALASAARTGTPGVTPLAAAVIESNGANPDRISLYSGSSIGGTTTMRVPLQFAGGSVVSVDRRPYGFAANDVIVLAPEDKSGRCALVQVAADPATQPPPPAAQTISIAAGGALRYNPANLAIVYAANLTRVFNLGPASSLSFHTWSVANGFLRLQATNLGGATSPVSTVVDNVVSIKAQYGFDTRPAGAFVPGAGMQVSRWSASMIDADSDAGAVVGGAGDYARIAALRIAVVARSKSPEKPNANGVCSATTVLPTVFGSTEPAGVAAVPIQVEVAVADDPVDWKCYRYRVFETLVALRNSQWSPN
jgi:type IV pilus assembly protein PilW